MGARLKELSLTFKLLVIKKSLKRITQALRAIINFQALGDRKIPQEDHTGTCLKGLSLTFKLLPIEQITGEIG